MKKIILVSGILLTLVLISYASWVIETVDSSLNVGLYTSLALDSDDKPHIAYFDSSNMRLKYAFYDGSSWQISVVDSTYAAGVHCSLALDSYDHAHISYEANNDSLKYAYFDGSNWQISTVETASQLGSHTSLALDDNDLPHISYHDYANHQLKYAYYDGSIWHISVVDTDGFVGYRTSLGLDSNDYPRISYLDYINDDLKYAEYDGTDWNISVLSTQLDKVIDSTSLALDNSNYTHITYYSSTYSNLYYKHQTSSGWQTKTVDSDGDVGQSSSLVLDNGSYPHISYRDATNSHLKYAHQTSSNWYTETVDNDGGTGYSSSIKLNSIEMPHISYYRNTTGVLKYAYYIINTGVSLLSFSAQPQSNSAIKLVWQVAASDDTQIVGFNLYRAGADKAHKKDWTRLNSSPVAANEHCQYVDSSVQAGQGYHYRLSAITADGKEEMLGTAQGEAGTTPAQFALVAVYPNPTSSLLTCRLTMPQAGSVSLGLYDISGRLVLSQRMELASGEQETVLEVGNLAKGIYTVRASSGGESVTRRIVVMR